MQGETNLWACMRSNPSESWETAEAEGTRHLAVTGRSGAAFEQQRGTGRKQEIRRRGDLWKTTREEVQTDSVAQTPIMLAVGEPGAEEPLRPNRAFEGDGKERGSRLAGDRTRHQYREGPEDSAHSVKSQGGKQQRPPSCPWEW